MILKNTPQQAPEVTAPIDGRILFSNEQTECILITLQPGDSIPAHKNPFDVVFLGLQGTATFTFKKDRVALEPYQTLFVSSEENRMMGNLTNSPIKVMVIKLLGKA